MYPANEATRTDTSAECVTQWVHKTDLVEFVGVTQHHDDFRALLVHHLPEVCHRRRQWVLGGNHLGTRRDQILGRNRKYTTHAMVAKARQQNTA